MRHRVAGYKLNRKTGHRRSLFRNLAAALFQHGRITTTLPKAKAVQPFVEKLITLARRGDLASRRRAVAILQDRKLVTVDKQTGDPVYEQRASGRDRTLIQKLFEDIGPRYADRQGGYTRIIRLAEHRIGDGSDLVVLQLVGEDEGGPNVSGRFSRRRQKQDGRTAFAAKVRKSGRPQDQEESASDDQVETDAAEAPAEQAEAAETTGEAEEAAAAAEATEVAQETDEASAEAEQDKKD